MKMSWRGRFDCSTFSISRTVFIFSPDPHQRPPQLSQTFRSLGLGPGFLAILDLDHLKCVCVCVDVCVCVCACVRACVRGRALLPWVRPCTGTAHRSGDNLPRRPGHAAGYTQMYTDRPMQTSTRRPTLRHQASMSAQGLGMCEQKSISQACITAAPQDRQNTYKSRTQNIVRARDEGQASTWTSKTSGSRLWLSRARRSPQPGGMGPGLLSPTPSR